MNERFDPQTGEILEKINLPAMIDTSMATAVVKAELDTQITTARAYPRSIQTAIDNIDQLATMTEQMATECVYALPRAGKPIRGPSIRLAEIIAQCWGNCVSKARIVSIDRINKTVTAEGLFHDLQTNSMSEATHTRRISNKEGRLFNEDMISVTCNAAQSIARRNAILTGVPKVVWWHAFQRCERVIAGDVTTLVAKRDSAIKAFAAFGLKPEQVFQILEVKGDADIGMDELVTLRTLYGSVKSGELAIEELLAAKTLPPTQPPTPTARKTLDDFANGGKGEAPPAGKQNDSKASGQEEESNASPASGQGAPDNATAHQSATSGAPAAAPEKATPEKVTPTKAGAEAKVAEKQAEKDGETKTKAAAERAGPKTEADYIAHANAWTEETEDADALEQRWTSEKNLRNKANVTAEVRDQLQTRMVEKVAKLRGQG